MRFAGPRVAWPVKFVALVLIWGSSFVLMKVGLESLHPMQIAGLRILTGTIVVVGLLAVVGGRLPTEPRVWAHLLVCGFFLAAFPFVMFATSETRIASALAGIGNATTPIATVVATMAMLPGERVTGRRLAAVAIGFLGVIVILQPWSLDGRPDLIGFGMALAGGASYGVGWTYNRRFLADRDLGGLSQPAATLVCGLAWMVPAELAWAAATPAGLSSLLAHPAPESGPVWLPLLAVLALGVIGTGFAYMLQFDVVRAAGPVVGSTITYLIPIVSVLLGVVVLGERLTVATVAGFAVVLGAAVVINRTRRPNRPGPRGTTPARYVTAPDTGAQTSHCFRIGSTD